MKCEICHRGIPEAGILHRQNEIGEVGIWRCERCNMKLVPAVVQKVLDALGKREGRKIVVN